MLAELKELPLVSEEIATHSAIVVDSLCIGDVVDCVPSNQLSAIICRLDVLKKNCMET